MCADPKILGNVVLKRDEKLEETNIHKVRERKQKKTDRSRLFHLKVHDITKSINEQTEKEPNMETYGLVYPEWYRNTYRSIM